MEIDIPSGFTEAVQVVRTLSFQHGPKRYRVEVVRALDSEKPTFRADYYESRDGTWREMTGVPYADTDTEDMTAHQALHWLAKHLKTRG